jgi:hypothetical protein
MPPTTVFLYASVDAHDGHCRSGAGGVGADVKVAGGLGLGVIGERQY